MARVRDAKPRTAPEARRRDGDIAPYRNGTAPRGAAMGRGGGMVQRAVALRAKFAGVMAVGREPGGPAADHHAARVRSGCNALLVAHGNGAPQRDRTTGDGDGVRQRDRTTVARRREPGGPAAKHRALPQRDTSVGRGNGARQRGGGKCGKRSPAEPIGSGGR